MDMESLKFTIPEILSLIGLVQCVYVLVYMAFRSGSWARAAIPFAYFFVLACAFLSGFATRFIGESIPHFTTIQWALWYMGPPLSVLLMIQIARMSELPRWFNFFVLLLVPVALGISVFAVSLDSECKPLDECATYADWLTVTGLLAGAISMAVMWAQRAMLQQMQTQPGGADRYWLVLMLVFTNLFFLATMLLGLTPVLGMDDAVVIRTIWGLGFVYLAGTSLFRIYPQALKLVARGEAKGAGDLSGADRDLAQKIDQLLTMDKVYHEPTYGRAHLARELGVSETVISRVVNVHFGKTLPQILNERRVADAKILLRDTKAPVKTVAEEVGFNSIASFNRVFKEIEGVSPGQFREKS
ncbi:helix-turn-helix transcriptional regulator [Micavibrio aeruginosavorus]|uniref:Bacterial regulatory helix-turn-helix s, AraC family protein n=1 Tax=Micavibrio aeruginosavorus (strain ARL-13) TaxID=856793 RepID=G2KPN0_MICAA|nr:helix-turn-helix transcriptional regulator [Micavibrio aeruginosavorus]AEP09849.1 bacterial regulatory helix-turn-helix s, AraC family protein [Micavibrio aeruginosavorus ARL-13]